MSANGDGGPPTVPSGEPPDELATPRPEVPCINRANPRQFNPLFFSTVSEDIVAAKAICAGCLVREGCLELAVRECIDFGVWGGTIPAERIVIRRQRRLQ